MALSYREVAEILKIIDASDCEEVVLELEGTRLVVRRGGASGAAMVSIDQPTDAASTPETPDPQRPRPASAAPDGVAVQGGSTDGLTVYSPMVGTFYRSPSPEEAPFVEEGTKVSAGDPLCLIEVMKLFTTIEATIDGIVEAVLADDGKLVEFDQPLFVIAAA